MECIALKAAMALPSLLLQRPHPRSRTEDHARCLNGRLSKWLKGDIDGLMHECESIQNCLNHQHPKKDEMASKRTFDRLVSMGNLKAAIRLVTDQDSGQSLPLDSTQPDGRSVRKHLLDKHPVGTPALASAISDTPPATKPHPIIFDRIDGPLIRSLAQKMEGSLSPSGLDSIAWKHLCSSFKSTSVDLCNSIASLTRRLCSSYVDPQGISSLTACRLVVLDKRPGVRPIGVGETLRRLISKAVLHVTRDDILKAVGCQQLCAGQEAATVSAILAMRSIFEDEVAEAALMVDASNAFNSLNREVTLRNTHIPCPSLAPVLTNTYRSHSRLFIGGGHIFSQEGTTQGDPAFSHGYVRHRHTTPHQQDQR